MRWSLPALLVCLIPAAAGGENLIYNGDFELDSDESPPPGWVMWGAKAYKTPANYTREATGPHGGTSCFRIRHPANTAGYIVSAPERAIRPKEGMTYTVSFWARADGRVSSVFGFTAYQSIRPFTGAPSPGSFPIEVGTDWKQYTFRIHEGWEFFADRCRYLMLTFKATTVVGDERTLWIDDVVVTEAPSGRSGRLLDRDRLRYEPLQHRLTPGERLSFAVDATKRLRRANRNVGGVSFHRVAGWAGLPYDKEGRYTLPAEMERAIRDMRLPMTRFYAVGVEPFSLEASIDKVAELLDRINVPQERVPLEFEIQGATSILPPEVWARGVAHALDRGYKFRLWEITNEPYIGRSGRAFGTADDFLTHFVRVSEAIRKVHPDGQIGLPIHSRSLMWGSYLLKAAAGHYDFVVGHYYCFMNVHESSFEDVALTGNFKVLDDVLRVGALMRAYNPEARAYQYDTEWGMHSRGRKGERAGHVWRNGNIFGTIHRAVRLIYYAREDIVRGASSWEMFSTPSTPGFGLFARQTPGKRHMVYWLYYYFNRHVGEWVLVTDGTAPYHTGSYRGEEYTGPMTPAIATLSEDERTLYLVVANGSWTRSVPCEVLVRNFSPARATAVVLSHNDPDAHPRFERREDVVGDLPVTLAGARLTCSIPPHAVVFMSVAGRRPDR